MTLPLEPTTLPCSPWHTYQATHMQIIAPNFFQCLQGRPQENVSKGNDGKPYGMCDA
jgi:hypothetical protein